MTAIDPPLLAALHSPLLSVFEDDGDESVAPVYAPSLDFSDPRNSQYAAGQFSTGVGVN